PAADQVKPAASVLAVPDLIGRAGRFRAQAQAVTVEVFDVHLAQAPGEIGRLLPDDRAGMAILLVQRVDVIDEHAQPGARLTLSAFAEEDFDLVPCDAGERLVFALARPVPLLLEPQLVDVVVDARRDAPDG